MDMNNSWGIDHILQLDLLPCVADITNMLLTVHAFTWLQTLLVMTVLALICYCIFLPMNYVRDLSDVGYDHLLEDSGLGLARRKGRKKSELVKEVRRLRKVGKLPPVYPNGWFSLLDSTDLAPGNVQHVAALGENFAVFRTLAGVVHILDAYCPHLGANMAVGGAVRGDCLECPFHLWRFKGEDGMCSAIPYSDKVPVFARVKKWPSCEENNIIFVWYHAEEVEPSWHPTSIPQIQTGQWRYGGRNEFIVNSHIQDIPENAADVAHLNGVHSPSLLAGSDLRYTRRLLYSFARHIWSANWQPNPDVHHQSTMHMHHEFRLFNKIPIIVLDGHIKQIERDIMIWNHKTYTEKPLLVKEDQSIRRHRHWFSQFYSENSPQFRFQQENTDW